MDEELELRNGVLVPRVSRRSFLGWTAALVAVGASTLLVRQPAIQRVRVIMTRQAEPLTLYWQIVNEDGKELLQAGHSDLMINRDLHAMAENLDAVTKELV